MSALEIAPETCRLNWRTNTKVAITYIVKGEGSMIWGGDEAEQTHFTHVYLPHLDNEENETYISKVAERLNKTLYRYLICALTPEIAIHKYKLQVNPMSQCKLVKESLEENRVILYIYANSMGGVSRHLLDHGKITALALRDYKKVELKLLKYHDIDIK